MPNSYYGREIGRIEGELKGIVATLARVDERSVARDEAFEEIRNELRLMATNIATLNRQAADQLLVTQQFNNLQQSIREAGIQAKGIGKGITIGIGLAGVAAGGTAVAFAKEIVAFIVKILTP